MNSFNLNTVIGLVTILTLFIVLRKSGTPIFCPENIGPGNYEVKNIIPGSLSNSYFIELIDLDTKNIKKFKADADDAGYINISVINPSLEGEPKSKLWALTGETFSVIRTNDSQGHGLAYAKW